MITTQEQLVRAIADMRDIDDILDGIDKAHPNASPSWRAVLAEGWIDLAKQLRGEIYEYMGISMTAEQGTGK